MKKSAFLILILYLLNISCTNTVTKTVIEKEIVYLQKKDDTLLRVKLPKKNRNFHQFKIFKHDTIFYAGKDTLSRKSHFDKFDSIYKIKATFKNKHIEVGSHDEYIQKAEIKNVTYKNTLGQKSDYILKRLTQRYQDYKVTGLAGTKHNLQFFYSENTCNLDYELNFYTDNLKIYEQENYLLTTIFGCCTSLPEYELFDLKGNFIFHSNNLIKFIKTEYNHYLISALKTEVDDPITIIIQDKFKNKQYVTLSQEIHNYQFGENFYLKIKKNRKPEKGSYDLSLVSYNLKSIDDLEIWIPFNKADTLKIPFQNQKAFGLDHPQIKVSLSEKQ